MTSFETVPANLEWTDKPARFRFALSDLRLFSISFAGKASTWPVPLAGPLPDVSGLRPCAFPPGMDVIQIRNLPITTPLPRLRLQDAGSNQSNWYYIDLHMTFESYLGILSSKTRSTLKRTVKKFAEMNGGLLDCRLYTTPNEMAEYHRLARTIAVNTYQEKLFDGAIPADVSFRKDLLELAVAGQVWGFVLFAQDKPVSYLHLPIFNDVLEYTFLGYDPSYSTSSPGTVLLYLALERIFAEKRFHRFDFGYGVNQTKEVFSAGAYLRADVYYCRATFKHLAVIYSHACIDFCSVMCGRILDRIGLRRIIKKLLRG